MYQPMCDENCQAILPADTCSSIDLSWADLQEILQVEKYKSFTETYQYSNADNSADRRNEIYKDIEESCRKFEAKMKKKRVRRSYTPYQVFHLENFFQQNNYPTNDQKRVLAITLDVSETRVKTWFHNRRQKYKKFLAQESQENTNTGINKQLIQGYQNHQYGVELQNRQYGTQQDINQCDVENQHNYLVGDNQNQQFIFENYNVMSQVIPWNCSPAPSCSSVQSCSSRSSSSPTTYYCSSPNSFNM